MKPLLLLLLLCVAVRADDGDDTLRGWLAKSELVVSGTITNEPVAIQFDSGFARYSCDFKVEDVLKGEVALAGQTIQVTITRSELDTPDRMVPIQKDHRCILFLKKAAADKPAWQTVDMWFGLQPTDPARQRSLKRLADEMAKPAADFDIECRKRDDRITTQAEGDRVVLDVVSPSGISGAQIVRKAARWPAAVMVRIHLARLEAFGITSGRVTLSASVQSHGDFARRIKWAPDEVRTLEPALLRAFTSDGRPTDKLPGLGGWFELSIPKDMLDRAGNKLEVNWIDFYR